MTERSKSTPKVFISYSWTNPEHEARVLEWAQRLRGDGVDVIFDKWDFKEGHDKFAFMEQMVTDPTVSNVVVFSDARYAQKADSRAGGVGTESQIISKEVYEKVKQEKFIPVVCEFDGDKPCLPTFLSSRKYLDFSSPEKINENYEMLLRAIFGQPLHKKPALGKPPAYIFDESKTVFPPRVTLTAFQNAVMNDRNSYKGLASHFLEEFFLKLDDLRIQPDGKNPIDELVVSSISELSPFKDVFVDFAAFVCRMKDEPEMYELITDFFERSLGLLHRPPGNIDPFYEEQFDNFRFLLYELFLYLVGLLVKYKRFDRVSILWERKYLKTDAGGGKELVRFGTFCAHCSSFLRRNERLRLGRLSLEADFVKNRASSKEVSFEQLRQADALCFLRDLLDSNASDRMRWMPHTLVYSGFYGPFELFLRGESHADFKRIASLLGVASKQELIDRFNERGTANRIDQWTFFFHAGVSLRTLYNLEKLDTI